MGRTIGGLAGTFASSVLTMTQNGIPNPGRSYSLANVANLARLNVLVKGVVPDERIELPTFGLQNRCSTAELIRQFGTGYGWFTSCSTIAFDHTPVQHGRSTP